ncbi:MAG: methyl-accepting chemotaxis protein [Elusimicrobia bacterium]|nr:methyl-accepting chemotaxis protein [Elusimicrobiota bacterium]
MAEAQKFQRRTVLVKRALQLKYIGLVFLSVLCATLIIGGDIYYHMYRLIAAEAPSLAGAAAQFNSIIVVKVILYLALMLLISVFVSHRFAGPIYRFEKSAQAVAKGDLTHRVCLRTGDELMELQEEFNAMIAGLQVMVRKDRNLAEHLAARIDELAAKFPGGAVPAEELASLKLELRHLTQSFKV